MLQGDFFLHNVCDEFMEGARLLVFESYCRIHNKLDISMLASKMEIQEVIVKHRQIVVVIVANFEQVFNYTPFLPLQLCGVVNICDCMNQ